MKHYLPALLMVFVLFGALTTTNAQVFDGDWVCEYATTDDGANGTGYNTIAVGVVSENTFVALVNRGTSFYTVGYRDADSAAGRIEEIPYAESDFRDLWRRGFNTVELHDPYDLTVTPWNNYVYIANNDTNETGGPAGNILVFELTDTDVASTSMKVLTGLPNLRAIENDNDGRIYLTSWDEETDQSSVYIIDNIDNEASWTDSSPFAEPTFLQSWELPVQGRALGLTVNGDGSVLYVSCYDTGEIFAYTGNPTDGYTLSPAFSFQLIDDIIVADSAYSTASAWKMDYLDNNNILSVAYDAYFELSGSYEYARIYFLNPNTGSILDTIDVAHWNYINGDSSYSSRPGGTAGTFSGYASTYETTWDENNYLYSQSYYGWTVEKWSFTGELPQIELTITSVKQTDAAVPAEFMLEQNYPNPFNPSTTITFNLNETSNVRLEVFDITGELVTTLINGREMSGGTYEMTFDASRLSSGTYIYRLSAGSHSLSKTMTLLK